MHLQAGGATSNRLPKVDHAPGFERYKGAVTELFAHEAGYDAYMTGDAVRTLCLCPSLVLHLSSLPTHTSWSLSCSKQGAGHLFGLGIMAEAKPDGATDMQQKHMHLTCHLSLLCAHMLFKEASLLSHCDVIEGINFGVAVNGSGGARHHALLMLMILSAFLNAALLLAQMTSHMPTVGSSHLPTMERTVLISIGGAGACFGCLMRAHEAKQACTPNAPSRSPMSIEQHGRPSISFVEVQDHVSHDD